MEARVGCARTPIGLLWITYSTGKWTPPGDYLDTPCGPAGAALRNNAISALTRTSPTRCVRLRRQTRTRVSGATSRENTHLCALRNPRLAKRQARFFKLSSSVKRLPKGFRPVSVTVRMNISGD
jgi:hypothetical protein